MDIGLDPRNVAVELVEVGVVQVAEMQEAGGHA